MENYISENYMKKFYEVESGRVWKTENLDSFWII